MSRYGVVSVSFGLAGLFLLGTVPQAEGDPPDWCPLTGTGGSRVPPGCDEGECDFPSERDSWLEGGSPQTVSLRIKFLVFGDDPYYAATPDDVIAQLDQLNTDFDEYYIEFSGDADFIDDNDYYDFCAQGTCICIETDCRDTCESEEKAMKTAYADDPDEQLNVYVVDLDTHTDYRGVGYFPWCSEATGTLGGVIIDDDYFGGQGDCWDEDAPGAADCQVLTHEIGHNLGLWHTHHGVSEVTQCGSCYEPADVEPPECDGVGDFCCDTRPTPTNYDCEDPEFYDVCSEKWFEETPYTNYMGYGGDGCWVKFTGEQKRRIHCWMCNELGGWVSGESIAACCREDDSCLETTDTCCDNTGGTFVSGASTCGSTGACCLGDGGCEDDTPEACCVDDGGAFVGSESSCEAGEEHACCLPDDTCIDTTEQCCQAWDGGYYPNRTCATPGWACPTQNK